MLSPVVAGVDGSAESLAAAEWAAGEAVRSGRSLRLLHAGSRRPRQGEPELGGAEDRHLARRVLRDARERVLTAYPGVRVYDEQVEGPAPAALAEAAGGADLLVLGSRGLGRITGLLVGSVALGVVAKATRPVVLVRADGPGERPADAVRRDVVLGVDVTEPCDEVIEFAFEAARTRDTRLRALYAWRAPDPLTLGPGEVGLVSDQQRAGEWLGFLSAVLRVWRDKYPDVEVLESVVQSKPAGALTKAASGAELLVVGHRLTDRPRMPRTGPVTHAVIHHVTCPVAVVPHH